MKVCVKKFDNWRVHVPSNRMNRSCIAAVLMKFYVMTYGVILYGEKLQDDHQCPYGCLSGSFVMYIAPLKMPAVPVACW